LYLYDANGTKLKKEVYKKRKLKFLQIAPAKRNAMKSDDINKNDDK